MRYIEKIEISKFRSFGENEKIEPFDYNVFSGSNDSGKSNVLKALNLFFNNQTDFNTSYNSDSDFNKWFRDNKIRGQRNISIKITFSKGKYLDTGGINNGFIAEKIYADAGGIDIKFYKLNGDEIKSDTHAVSYKRANDVIAGKTKFVYIPTVRDIRFRENIQRQIENIAESTDERYKNKNLQQAFSKFEEGLIAQLNDLKKTVKNNMNIDVDTTINFGALLESMGFKTKDNIKISKRGKGTEIQEINLKNRGEGIQMHFFSLLLWFISKNDKKHNYIWGYEEPEVAFEMKRQFQLADIFQKEISKDVQIFVTTHSPAFAFATENEKSKIYRVSYEKDTKTKMQERKISRIYPLNDYYDELFTKKEIDEQLKRDIWGVNIQKLSYMLGSSLDEITNYRHIGTDEIEGLKDKIKSISEAKEKIQKEKEQIHSELLKTYPLKIFICEDEECVELWRNIFEKNDMKGIVVKYSMGCSNNSIETTIQELGKNKSSYPAEVKVFRQLDRDGFSDELIQMVENKKNEKGKKGYGINQYCVKYLPVNEMENFGILLSNKFTDDIVKAHCKFLEIHNAFSRTIESNCNSAKKLFIDNEQDRNKFNHKALIPNKPTNILKLYPGKDIKKKINPRFNAIKMILNCDINNYPQELKNYLEIIKTFFNVPN